MKNIIWGLGILFLLSYGSMIFAAKQDFASKLDPAVQQVDLVFKGINQRMDVGAQKLSQIKFDSEQAAAILNQICDSKDYLIDCAIVDPQGKIVAIQPVKYQEYLGANLRGQKKLINKKMETPILSDYLISAEKIRSVVLRYPIFSSKKQLIGSLSLLIDPNLLLKQVIEPIVKDTKFKIWVMDLYGNDLYDPDQDQVGKNIFKDPMYKKFGTLISFCHKVAAEKQGVGSYNFYKFGYHNKQLVEKECAWDSVNIHGTEWRLISYFVE